MLYKEDHAKSYTHERPEPTTNLPTARVFSSDFINNEKNVLDNKFNDVLSETNNKLDIILCKIKNNNK